MKIHITGNAGSGKTTLAKELSANLDFPLFHLDQVVWQSHWKKTSPGEREDLEKEILSNPSWIIEGVSMNVRAEADIVIFLDVPRYKCIWRCINRNLPYLFKSRPELPPHCPEILIFPKLLSIIWRFPALMRTTLLQEAADSNNMLIIKTSSELNAIRNGVFV